MTGRESLVAPSAARRIGRSFEYWALRYRRTWRGTVASGFVSPVLFLSAMGLGLGGLVDAHSRAALGGARYLDWLAPGLLAASTMQTAVGEGSWPVLGAFKWVKTYHAMTASPLGSLDVLAGHLLWIAVRLTLGAAAFVAIMALFGAASSPWVVMAVPVAVLTGMAFAAPMCAFSATQDNDSGFTTVFRVGIIPLFLFSGTFFPVSQLPSALRPVAYLTPLWHGVALCRSLSLGDVDAGAAGVHLVVVGAFALAGTTAAAFTYRRRLVA